MGLRSYNYHEFRYDVLITCKKIKNTWSVLMILYKEDTENRIIEKQVGELMILKQFQRTGKICI